MEYYNKGNRNWIVKTSETEPDNGTLQKGKQNNILECYNKGNRAR